MTIVESLRLLLTYALWLQMENGDVDTPMSDQFTRTGEEMTLQKLSVFVIDMKFRLEVGNALSERKAHYYFIGVYHNSFYSGIGCDD